MCTTTPVWHWGWFESRGFKYATLPHAFGVLFLMGFHYHQARNHHPPSNSPGGKNRESSLPHCSLVPRYVLSLSKANFPGTFFHSITFLSPAYHWNPGTQSRPSALRSLAIRSASHSTLSLGLALYTQRCLYFAQDLTTTTSSSPSWTLPTTYQGSRSVPMYFCPGKAWKGVFLRAIVRLLFEVGHLVHDYLDGFL